MSLGKDRADKIKQKEAIEQSKCERHLQKAPLLKVKAEALWDALIARLASEIADFNGSLADHPDCQLRWDSSPTFLEIKKSKYSQEHLTAHLKLAEERIAIRRVTTPAPGNGPQYEMKETLDLDLDDDKRLYVRRQSQIIHLDALLDFLLEHMME